MYAISSYRGNRPTNKQTHKQTNKYTNRQPETGPITIHCGAKLSAQRNNTNVNISSTLSHAHYYGCTSTKKLSASTGSLIPDQEPLDSAGGSVSRLPLERVWRPVVHPTFLPARRSKRGICYGDVAGWLSVTRRSCTKTAKPILKLFPPAGSPIILVSSDPAPIHNSKGNPFSGGVKYTGVGKIGDFRAIFDGNRRLSRKRRKIGRWLLWNVNRKSWVPD